MSLAYPINDIDDVIYAFAAKDEFISCLTYTLHRDQEDNSSSEEEYVMTPNDDYYVAPYCFILTRSAYTYRSQVGFLVFSSMVPFVERNEHDDAKNWIQRGRRHEPPFIGTMEKFQQRTKAKENDIYTFTNDGCFPSAEDVSQELEDMAIRVVCDLMNWKFPIDWRKKRRHATFCRFAPVLDLADYDRRHENQGQQHQLKRQLQDHHPRHQLEDSRQQQQHPQEEHQHFYDAKQFATDDKHDDNNEEEKKETSALEYLPLPPLLHTPIREQRNNNGGGFLTDSFFEKNADIFGSSKGSRYYYENHDMDDFYDEEDDDGNTFISSYNVVNDEDDLYGI